MAREEFLRRLVDACQRLAPAVRSAALFGSVARRESGVASDVDLLLAVPDVLDTGAEAWQEQVRDLEERVLAWSGNRLEIITVTRGHLAEIVESDEPIVRSWQEDALTLTGTDPRDLLVRGSRRRRTTRADDSSKEAR